MMRANRRRAGFTLAELLVASIIGAFIAVVAVGTLKTVSDSAHLVSNITESCDEVRFAARLIEDDLSNLYRDPNMANMKLIGTSGESVEGGAASVAMYTVCRAKARPAQAEGDVYEVEYSLIKEEEKSTLFRRLWPYPDKDRDPGGVLSPVAENVSAFEVRFFDGKQWSSEWTEKMETLPQLVQVTIVSQPPGLVEPTTESFTVNFVRLAEAQTTATSESTEGGQAEQSGGQSESEAQGGGQAQTGSQGQPEGGQGGGRR